MAFSSALSNAISGMNAAATSAQVRAHNIANATDPGFARRDVELGAGTVGGVRIVLVSRATDALLTADRISAEARAGASTTQSDAVARINALFGEPGDTDGLIASITRFDAAMADLATSPESASFHRAMLTAAQELTGQFGRLGDEITDMRLQADQEIAARVNEVNDALHALRDLNGEGVDNVLTLGDIAESQQSLIDQIGASLDIVVARSDSGKISIRTQEGVPLLGEHVREVSFRPGGVPTPGTTIASGHLSGLSVDGVDITPGQGGAQAIRSGTLAGLFSVRDDIAPDYGARLDRLASDLVERFSGGAGDPTLPAGTEGLFTTGRATGVPGAASALSVNPAVNPSEGGALWRLRDGIGATGPGPSAGIGVLSSLRTAWEAPKALSEATDSPAALSFSEGVSAFASVIGTDTVGRAVEATTHTATAQTMKDRELAAIGVNTDDELQRVLLIEQAYAANARVVQAVSDMMARLLEI